MIKAVVFASMLGVVGIAHAEAPVAPPAIPAGDVTQTMTCDQANARVPNVKAGMASAEEIIIVGAALNQCLADAYNKQQETTGSKLRALPSAQVSQDGDKRTVAFGVITLSPDDAGAIGMICKGAAGAVGIATAQPQLAGVVTEAGRYSCDAYVKALMASDKLLLIAPTLIPGISITKDVLARAGIPQDQIDQAQHFIEKGVGDAATGAAQVGVATVGLGVVKIDKTVRCVKVFGKRVCR